MLGASWDFDRVVREQQVEDVVFTFSTAPADVYLRLMKRSQELGACAHRSSLASTRRRARTQPACLGGLPLVTSHARNPKGWEFATKYALDRAAAVVMLALLAPLFGIFAFAVLLSLGRPIFYRQERIGLDGRPSEC